MTDAKVKARTQSGFVVFAISLIVVAFAEGQAEAQSVAVHRGMRDGCAAIVVAGASDD